MANTPVAILDGTLTDIADAIRGKNGSSDTYKPGEMPAAITAIPSGGGDVVNGIISRFKATSDTVDANTFVEFVNTITPGTDTRLVATSDSYYNTSAVLVDANTVFIAHRSGSYLYGIVCSISGSTITPGTDTQLSTITNSYYDNSPVLIDTNKIFIAHRGDSYHLNGLLCTISGTSITVDADIELSSVYSSYQSASAVLLDTNKVFIAHRGADDYLCGMVCTISESTITAGTDTRLMSTKNTYKNTSAVLVDANKVFVSHASTLSDYDHIYGVVCTISGTTITPGSNTQIVTGTYAAEDNALALVETNKVFIIYRNGNYLYGVVCTISGTTITPGSDTQLTTTTSSFDDNSLALVEPNRFFIVHEISFRPYGIVCTISGTTITIGTDTLLTSANNTSDYAKVVRVDTDKVLVAHRGSSNYLYGMVCTAPEITVKAATSQFTVGGITKSACTSATEGDVWVLN